MIIVLMNGMISMISMTYGDVRKDPDLTEYDKELLQHLLGKGKCMKLFLILILWWPFFIILWGY